MNTSKQYQRDMYIYIEFYLFLGNSDIQWCFSQVKGTLEDDATEGGKIFPK